MKISCCLYFWGGRDAYRKINVTNLYFAFYLCLVLCSIFYIKYSKIKKPHVGPFLTAILYRKKRCCKTPSASGKQHRGYNHESIGLANSTKSCLALRATKQIQFLK